jgi:ATP-binding cassette subfamily B protein
MLAVQAAAVILGYARDVTARRMSQEALFSLRTRMFAALQRRTLLSLEREKTGALMARLLEEPAVLESLFWGSLAGLVTAPLTFLGIAVVIFMMDVELALVALLPIPVMALLGLFFVSKMRAIAPQLHERMAGLYAFLQEKIAAASIVRLFGARKREVERFRTASDSYMELRLRMDKLMAQYLPLLGFLTMLGMAFVLAWGSEAVLRGSISAGKLIAFVTYLAFFYGPLTEMSRANFLLQNAVICVERIQEILEPHPKVVESRGTVRLQACGGRIELRDVSFWYDDGDDATTAVRVLDKTSLTIGAGERIAVVGPTGSGKSTLVKLLLGLYAPREGEILLDGVSLASLDEESVALCLSAVMQDDIIFNDTLAANIAYGCPDGGDSARIEEAVRLTMLDEVVGDVPAGLDTVAGEGGWRLSGGERQRLSIARAIMRKPLVLVLDEATSALDVETEQVVLERIFEHLKDSTIIVMSHRDSATRVCSRTLRLSAGKVG